MARDVDIGNALVKDFRTLPEQVIDRAIDHFLVTGNGCCREDDCIAGLNTYQAMVLVGDTRER